MTTKAVPINARTARNRANAAHSTGPKTEAGKKRSSLNAYRHGLTGQTIILPAEDLDAYQAFTRTFFNDYKPVGTLEKQLVQSLAEDEDGEILHLVTLWRSTKEEVRLYEENS